MADQTFKTLQAQHESLLQKQQGVTKKNQAEFTKEVRDFIEQAKRGGSHIAPTRERDQVRANLRYWANYIYGLEGVFPDTELAPSTVSEKQPVGNILAIILFIVLVLLGAIQAYRSTINRPVPATETPVSIETETLIAPATEPPVTTPDDATPTAKPSGINVFLSSPANGDFITPNVEFNGTYDNLRSGWAIHVLFIKSGKYFPIADNFQIPEKPVDTKWEIKTQLAENDEEMLQAQSYSIILVVSTNAADRKKLTNSSRDGIDIKSLPDTVIPFDNTATVFYRDPFIVIRRERTVVYSLSDGNSPYDLHIFVPERNYHRQLTFTQDVSELSPSMSPDGRKIAYVKRVKDSSGNGYLFAIAVMDSNGENEFEITARTKSILESAQWSSDGRYISYSMGDTSQSSERAAWNIHVYEIETKNDSVISNEPEELVQPYHTWLPDSNSIVFETRPQLSGTTGFDMALLGSSDAPSHFFDSTEDDIQPRLKSIENGYLITFTIVRQDKKHDIYGALLYPNRQVPFDGFQIILTNTRAGEIVRGLESASANFPIPDPDPNTNLIYYVRNNNIYQMEFNIVDGTIVRVEGKINDGERFGDEVIDPPLGQDIFGYDVGYMEAFFPLDQTSLTPAP